MPRRFSILLLVLIRASAGAHAGGDPKEAISWFQRAAEQMNLRASGSAPFHMKVKFHAYPGAEMINKPQIVTGDGTYEEMWLAPHQWRREVTLGSYHAIEVQSGPLRKIQASSDYEPSRVLMLLEGLYNPVPRNYLDPTLNDLPLVWKVEHESAKGINFVRISRLQFNLHTDAMGHQRVAAAYNFLSNGLLFQSNERGLETGWQDDTAFSGKAVPQHFTVVAMTKKLLEADVKVETVGKVDPAVLDLPGVQADPCMTMRPLHEFETKGLHILDGNFSFITRNPSSSTKVIREIIDRHGVVREAEVIDADDLASAANLLDGFRHMTWKPGRLDENPCEIAVSQQITG
jgi:hypothetical protein